MIHTEDEWRALFDSEEILNDDLLLIHAAADLVEKLTDPKSEYGVKHTQVHRVVGPNSGGGKLAEHISRDIKSWTGKCDWASPKKLSEGENMDMVFDNPERTIKPEEGILLCDMNLATGRNLRSMTTAIYKIIPNPKILKVVLVITNQSGRTEIKGRKIISLIKG